MQICFFPKIFHSFEFKNVFLNATKKQVSCNGRKTDLATFFVEISRIFVLFYMVSSVVAIVLVENNEINSVIGLAVTLGRIISA